MNRGRYCLVDTQPRAHYQSNEATAESEDRAMIDDTMNEQPECEHAISNYDLQLALGLILNLPSPFSPAFLFFLF